ncbi:SfnB family sulfur acquisition oxidoreductase [Gordonia sp. NB41Y]|uniref:SfnB family sulfur acquisition oxidoreductase n=1 Tax=Gordonia sp. NB41Y TaxID=875808 RepID=UPI0006B23795|nr:SfnB family sulfur acquisition oxidoreductase [Gordonia sp. NB41Y]EMP11260.2 monooxygenase [Gordonia sp. NB41Y]WLP91728.1 SfnB family sulfur acquisition oxidoreductase [Gordonia sp. NB41Y]
MSVTSTPENSSRPIAAQIESADQARLVAQDLAERFAAGAAARDLDRRLPFAEIDALSASGLLAISVPASFGGADLAPSVITDVIAILAAADPNIAQIPHSHFVYLNLLRLAAPEELARKQFESVLAGGRVANAQSERGGATIADISTTLTTVGPGRFRIDGEKFYATGSLYADTLAILARHPGDDELAAGEYIAFIPADTPGVAVVDDWDALGQRTTGSGTVELTGAEVAIGDLVERATAVSRPTGYGAFAQLLHVAIDVGIARGALAAAVEFVGTRSRPWFEAGVSRAVDDELLVQRFGELGVELVTAEATLDAAARAVDRATGFGGTPDDTVQAVAEASLAVAAAKVVADRVANSITSAVFEVSGTRSAAAGTGLDRFWRNARTHTLHDPVRWKVQHIGRHVLRGENPPIHGVI